MVISGDCPRIDVQRPMDGCGEMSEADAKGRAAERQYDLIERTARFGESAIRFAKKVSRDPVTTPIIGQLVRAATSIGANYCEADQAISKKDFRYKIGLCRKEANETKYWLRMVATAEPGTPVRRSPRNR